VSTLLVLPFTMYRYDASYAVDDHAAHPSRADTIAYWAASEGMAANAIAATVGKSALTARRWRRAL